MKRVEPLPLPSQIEQIFAELDALESGHPDARGTTYGAIRTAETRVGAPRMTQERS